MGMSASQMRYCMITGKKSDVEYQGQQINQQRTTLATQSSAFNTQLLNLSVPTPPSTSDFTKTNYSFTMGGSDCSISGSKFDSATGKYDINYTYATTADVANTGQSRFYRTGSVYSTGLSSENSTVLTSAILSSTNPDYDSTIAANLETIYGTAYDANRYTFGTSPSIQLQPLDLSNVDTVDSLETVYGDDYDSNNTYYSYITGAGTSADPTVTHYVSSSSIAGSSPNNTATSYVAGALGTTSNDTALTGMTNIGPQSYHYYQSGSTYRFVTGSQLAAIDNNSSEALQYSYVQENAEVEQEATLEDATVVWSDTGRMESITALDANDNETTYTLTVTTETDQDAYDDAYNEYEYQKNLYDQNMEGINANLCIIQSQDKKLELKLQDLDTQQEALSTEMDSVKKVVEKNVESSFKTFA